MNARLSSLIGVALLALLPGNERYIQDFEFIRKTVARNCAALKRRKLDWDGISARMRPLFAACKSDEDHVRNVMRYLAPLGDSHSSVPRGWSISAWG